MKSLLFGLAMAVFVTARPELYKEKEDFQYSRSSSDEGSKSGYYDAQRGNMGGNYERAHNMDTLAQHQMGGLMKQVEGELGDGTRTRSGNVFTSANSQGIFGSGRFDLSSLGDRNFGEGATYGESQSQSSAANREFESHSSLSRQNNERYSSDSQSHNSGYRGYQSGNLQEGQSLYGGGDYEHESHSGRSSRLYTQSGYHGRTEYDNLNQQATSIDGSDMNNMQSRARITLRPGSRVVLPINTQATTGTHTTTYYDQNARNTQALININDQQHTSTNNNPKQYESSYSYRKHWEKHDTKPAVYQIPVNSELYDSALSRQRSSQTSHQANEYTQQQKASSSLTDYNAAQQRSTSAISNLNAYSQSGQHSDSTQSANLIGSITSKPKSYQSSYSYHKSWERQGDPYIIKPTTNGDYNTQTSEKLTDLSGSQVETNFNTQHHSTSAASNSHLYSQREQNSDASSQTANLMGSLSSKPKSYQSSYSYHKSWERQGDPYIIKPATNGAYDAQTLQRLTDLSNQRTFPASDCVIECHPLNSHTRVSRSASEFQEQNQNTYNGQETQQQTQNKWENLEDLGQQTQREWNNLEDFGQQAQHKFDNLEELGQQTQDFGQQTQDFGQQTQNKFDNLEDFGQQTQDFGQQTQDLGQQTQDFGQQTQDFGQLTQDFGQQTQDFSQQTQDLGQQTQDFGQQTQDFGQLTQDFGQQTQDFGQQNTQEFGQQTQSLDEQKPANWDNQEKTADTQQEDMEYFNQQTQKDEIDQQNIENQDTEGMLQPEFSLNKTSSPWDTHPFDQTENDDFEQNADKHLTQYPAQLDNTGQQTQGIWDDINWLSNTHETSENTENNKYGPFAKEPEDQQSNQKPLFNLWDKIDTLTDDNIISILKNDTYQFQDSKTEKTLQEQQPITETILIIKDKSTTSTTEKVDNKHSEDVGRGDIGPEDFPYDELTTSTTEKSDNSFNYINTNQTYTEDHTNKDYSSNENIKNFTQNTNSFEILSTTPNVSNNKSVSELDQFIVQNTQQESATFDNNNQQSEAEQHHESDQFHFDRPTIDMEQQNTHFVDFSQTDEQKQQNHLQSDKNHEPALHNEKGFESTGEAFEQHHTQSETFEQQSEAEQHESNKFYQHAHFDHSTVDIDQQNKHLVDFAQTTDEQIQQNHPQTDKNHKSALHNENGFQSTSKAFEQHHTQSETFEQQSEAEQHESNKFYQHAHFDHSTVDIDQQNKHLVDFAQTTNKQIQQNHLQTDKNHESETSEQHESNQFHEYLHFDHPNVNLEQQNTHLFDFAQKSDEQEQINHPLFDKIHESGFHNDNSFQHAGRPFRHHAQFGTFEPHGRLFENIPHIYPPTHTELDQQNTHLQSWEFHQNDNNNFHEFQHPLGPYHPHYPRHHFRFNNNNRPNFFNGPNYQNIDLEGNPLWGLTSHHMHHNKKEEIELQDIHQQNSERALTQGFEPLNSNHFQQQNKEQKFESFDDNQQWKTEDQNMDQVLTDFSQQHQDAQVQFDNFKQQNVNDLQDFRPQSKSSEFDVIPVEINPEQKNNRIETPTNIGFLEANRENPVDQQKINQQFNALHEIHDDTQQIKKHEASLRAASPNVDHINIDNIPPEPTTAKPGFWASVGNKFAVAKNKVVSWFNR